MRLIVQKSVIEGTFGRSQRGNHSEEFMVKWIFDAMLKKREMCVPYGPNVWSATNIVFRWTSWLSPDVINTVRLPFPQGPTACS